MVVHRLFALRQLGARTLQLQRTSTLQPVMPMLSICQNNVAQVRWISSSENKPASHVGIAPNTVIDNPPRTAEDFAEAAKKPRNWISYGFCEEDIENDRDQQAFYNFCILSICIVFGVFFLSYGPDMDERDWCFREAHFELARREKHGLPLIDKELIPVERIQLPSEEELVGKNVYL